MLAVLIGYRADQTVPRNCKHRDKELARLTHELMVVPVKREPDFARSGDLPCKGIFLSYQVIERYRDELRARLMYRCLPGRAAHSLSALT